MMSITKKDIYMDKDKLNLEKIGKLNMNFMFINDFIEYFNLDTIDFGFLVLGLVKSLLLVLLMLGTIAFYILVERNVIGSIQRRKGPNNVGAYGLLQSIADGFKLILKEAVIPRSGNRGLFYCGTYGDTFCRIRLLGSNSIWRRFFYIKY